MFEQTIVEADDAVMSAENEDEDNDEDKNEEE